MLDLLQLTLAGITSELPEIISGFALLLLLSAVPGILLVRICSVGFSRLEIVVVGSAVGIQLFILLSFVERNITYRAPSTNILAVVVAVAILLLFVKRRRELQRIESVKHRRWPVIVVVGMGTLLNALPMWTSALWHKDGTLKFFGWQQSDSINRLAFVGELTHAFPPQFPYMSGFPLQYHYFVNLFVSALSSLGNVDPLIVFFRMQPIILFPMLGFTMFCFARRFLGNEHAALIATGSGMMAGSFGFVPGIFGFGSSVWDSTFQVAQTVGHYPSDGSFVLALILFFAGLTCVSEYYSTGRKSIFILSLLLLGPMAMVKVFGAVVICGGMLLAGLISYARDRRLGPIVLAVACSMIGAVVLLPLPRTGGNVRQPFEIYPFFSVIKMWVDKSELGLVSRADVQRAVENGSYGFLALLVGLGLLVYLVGNLGIRIIGLREVVRRGWNWKHLTTIEVLLLSFLVVAFGMTFTVRLSGHQYFYFALPILDLFMASLLIGTLQKYSLSRILAVGFFILLSLPTSIHALYIQVNPQLRHLSISGDEYGAMLWIRKNSLPESIVIADLGRAHYLSAIAQRRVVLAARDIVQVNTGLIEEEARRAHDVEIFYSSSDPEAVARVLTRYRIAYVFENQNNSGSQLKVDASFLRLRKVYSRGGFTVYSRKDPI